MGLFDYAQTVVLSMSTAFACIWLHELGKIILYLSRKAEDSRDPEN